MPLVDLGTGIRANQRSGSILDDGFDVLPKTVAAFAKKRFRGEVLCSAAAPQLRRDDDGGSGRSTHSRGRYR